MRMTDIDPHLTLADDGIERSLMAAAADWQLRAPMEPNRPALPLPQTSTVVQSIPPPIPPRSDDVQAPARETLTSASAAAAKSSALLSLDKFSYADIAAGRRSPSVSRQETVESQIEPTSLASEHSCAEPVEEVESVVPVHPVESGRSRWEQQQQDKLVQSVDPVADPKHHGGRSEQRRRQQKRPPQHQDSHGSRERHPPVTQVKSFDVPVQEETPVQEVKTMEQEAAPETVHRPKTTSARSPANLSPPGESEKRSRSPLWMPGSGGPSYADILRGHYIPHHQRGMVGIVDAPQQPSPQEQLHHIGGASIDETNEPEEHPAPKQQFVPPEPIEEVTASPEQETPPDSWMSHPAYDQPIVQQVEYSSSMFQPGNLSFETQYASAPDAEAVFASNFDLMALSQAYAQLEYNMPVAYPIPVFPVVQQVPSAHQNFEFNIEQPRQEYVPPPQEPEPVQIIPPVPEEVPAAAVQEPIEIPKSVQQSTTKLSYAQILSTGLAVPSEQSERRDSSGSGHASSSPRPKTSPAISDSKTDSAPSPSRLSVPERGVSEPREHRSRQRNLKASKSKSFDVREKEPSKTTHSKPAAIPVRPVEAKSRPKRKSNKSFSEDSEQPQQWTPVSVQVSPPDNKLAVPEPTTAVRSKSPGSAPTSSEPEMTKAMMTFYGISSEDIEQLISSRSHDSDSEAGGVETTTEKKKKKVQKMKKRKSSKVPDEDEIEKALREISELEKNKRSKMKRTHSHEIKSSEPVGAPPAEVIPVVTLELPDPEVSKSKQKEKKLKKAASVSGGHPIKSSLKPEASSLKELSTATGESSSGSSDPSAQKQRRDRIKRAKTVSFNQESVITPEPIVESQPKRRLSSPPADLENISLAENEAEFDVLDTQGIETVGHLVTDVEKMMEDAMSDDIIVLETENLTSSPLDVGQRTLDPQILEDVFTETASVFESPVCPELFQEEEEKSEAIPEEPVAAAEPVMEESPKANLLLGPIMVAEENKSDKIPSEMTGELPLGSQPAAAMTLLPLEVRVTLRKISACNTVPFLPEEIQLPLEDDSARHPPLRAAESVDLDSTPLEIAAALVFNQTDIETVDELEQDEAESEALNAEFSGSDQLTCISAITHMSPVTLSVVEQLPMLARQLSLAEEEFADESELSLPICTTPIPAMVEREEEALISAKAEEPPATNVYTPQVELPTQEQMIDIVEALLGEPKTEETAKSPITFELTEPVDARAEKPATLFSASAALEMTKPVPLVTLGQVEAPVETTSLTPPASDYKVPFGFDDADHVILSPQWMRQRSPLGRTFSLDPRTLSTVAKATSSSSSPLVKAHSTDLSESYGTEEQKAAAAAKSLDEGSKSESQTGGEADDEDVEVYWRLREKKKKKKRRAPVTTPTTNVGPRLSESSSDAFSLVDLPMSPSSVASDLPVSESTLTSDDEHRTKCTQDDGFQSGLSTPVLMPLTSPDSELRETLREISVETELVSETNLETSVAESPPATPTAEIPADVPILAGPCLLFTPEMAPAQLEQQDVPSKTEELPVEAELAEETAVEESPVTEVAQHPSEKESNDVPLCPASSWANLVATGKPKITEPVPEPEPAPRPARPLPTLVVVGEEEHHGAPCDPEGFHIGRKERRYMRKWRSSQSESQDVEETEPTETSAETPLPVVSEPQQVEEFVAPKPVPPPSPVEIDSESDEEMPEPVRVNLRAKVQKLAKSVRELEQRKRRSRLSESEQEVLELAEAIADKHVLCIRTHHDDHLQNLYLDSWPKPTKSTNEISEKLWLIAQQSQTNEPEIPESEQVFETISPLEVIDHVQPETEFVAEITEVIGQVEPACEPAEEVKSTETLESVALVTEITEIQPTELVIEPAPLCEVIDHAEPTTEPLVDAQSPEVEEDVEPAGIVKEEVPASQPCVLSWAKLVATSKPVVTESKEDVVEEPVRPKRPLPTLIVVGDVEEPAPVETDPDSFTEFVGRNERRRRKWRSSQSESQDYATDEEHVEATHVEPSAVKEEPELVTPEVVKEEPEKLVTPAPVKELAKDSDEEDAVDVPAPHRKEKKATTAKASIPVKEMEQRRRRARLSESEKEALDIAQVIEHGETTPQLYYDLFADSWPLPFYVFLRDAETRWKTHESLASNSPVEDQQPTGQESVEEVVEEVIQETAQVQEEATVCPPSDVEEPIDESPNISEIVITEYPEDQMIAKPLTWAAMVALSKPPPAPVEIPESPEQIAPRPSKMPLLLVYGEEEHHEAISSDDPDGFHECVSKRERRRRKWRSSQSESQDTDFVVETAEIASEAVPNPPVAPPTEPKVEDVDSQQPETRERSDSKSKRIAAAKVEKQTKEVERKRPKRLSESEREALQLAEAIESGQDVANRTLVSSEPYWQDKLVYSDIEKQWQESLSGSVGPLDDKMRSDKSRSDRRSPDSDPSPQPPPSNDSSSNNGASSSRLPTTQTNVNDADLPGAPANWSDESTFLAIESQEDQQQIVVYKVGIHPLGRHDAKPCICFQFLPTKKKNKARLASLP